MQAYGFALLPVGALLALGVGFSTFSQTANPLGSDPAAIEQQAAEALASASPIELTSTDNKKQMDAELSRWAAENNMEFVPAGPTVADPAPERITREDSGWVVIEADDDGGAPTVVEDERSTASREEPLPSNRTVRIGSISDLMKLDREDVRELERGNVDFDLHRMRDDVNAGLRRVGTEVRKQNQSFHVPGVRNASGTASTGASRWRGDDRSQQRLSVGRRWRTLPHPSQADEDARPKPAPVPPAPEQD